MKIIIKRVVSIVLCISMLCGMIVVGDASNDRTYADTAPSGLVVNPNNKAWIGEYPVTDLKTNIGDDLGTEANPFVVLEVVPTLDQAQFGYFIPGCEPIDLEKASKDVNGDLIDHTTLESYLNLTSNFDIKKSDDNSRYQVRNKDTFIDNVFDSSSYGMDSFVSNVITITPEELANHQEFIGQCDLIFFHTDNTNRELRKLWYAYHKDGIDPGVVSTDNIDFMNHDLTKDTVYTIMESMAGSNPPALIFEGTKVMGSDMPSSLQHNITKLMLMVTMFKPTDFVNSLQLLDTVKESSSDKDYLYYPAKKLENAGDPNNNNVVDDPDKSTNWSHAVNLISNRDIQGTFAWDKNGNSLKDYIRYDGKTLTSYNVFDKIFIYDGSTSMFQTFLNDSSIMDSNASTPLDGGQGKSDLVDFYGKDKTGYNTKDIMKYILSIPQYKPFLNVLEVQPCQQFIYANKGYKMKDANGNEIKDKNGNTKGWKEYYEGLFPWYDSDQDGGSSWVEDTTRLKVTTMTTAEFIGSTGRYEYGQVDEFGNPIQLTYESSDDLTAKYDMIVFGSMQDASNGKDGYNDPLLGNLLYTAVGDLVYKFDDPNYTTKVSTDSTKLRDRVRYSGTDISLKKMLELRDFLRAGKPIVVDQGLYKSNGEVDIDKVDKNSKLYDLLTWTYDPLTGTEEASKYMFRYGNYSGKEMKNIIAKSQCRLVFANDSEAYPLEYSYSSKTKNTGYDSETAKGVIEYENYQAKDADGKAILKFHFYVSGVPGSRYQVHLNLDYDGDGVYRGSLKQRSEIDNMNQAMGYSDEEKEVYDEAEIPLGLKIYDNQENYLGNSSDEGMALEEGKLYYATYELSKSRLGIVPWKLEVQDVTNQYLRCSAVDYTAFSKNDKATKAQINVLQMCLPHGGLWNWNNNGITGNFIAFTCNSVDIGNKGYYDPTYEYSSKAHDNPNFYDELHNLTGYSAAQKTAKKFETYLAPVDEFDVHIQFLYNKDWNTLFGEYAKKPVYNEKKNRIDLIQMTEEERLNAWKDFLSEYDMIVLGFEDENAFTSNTTFTKGFDDFISQGKGVILSHDTVEGANANSNYYGKYAPWLRTVSGQRRTYYNLQEDGTYKKSYLTTYTNGKIIDDPSRKNEYRWYSGSALANKVNSGEWSGYISPALLNPDKWGHYFSADTDLTSVEDEFMGTFVKENLDNAAQLYAVYGSDWNYWDDNKKKHIRRDSNDKFDRVISDHKFSSSWPDQNAGTSIIKLANNGQITTYPYLISPFITVANTHCQNYQLDMEYQVGGDVNVWFNLTDFGDPELDTQTNEDVMKEKNGTTNLSDKWTRIYSSKNQDSRNNFYIYNKGNITYTGSGHGTRHQTLTDDEVKLFVNTMISAYRAPEDGPYVTIDNATSTSESENLLYVDYDTKRDSTSDEVDTDILDGNIVTDSNGDRYVKVEFTLRDDTIVEDTSEESGSGAETGNGSSVGEGSGTAGEDIQEEPAGGAEGEVTQKTYYLSIIGPSNTKVMQSQIVTLPGVQQPKDVSGSDYMEGFVPNKKYIMYIPYESVSNGGQLDFTFTTYCRYKKKFRLTERSMRTPKNSTDLSVMILPLFDLN